MSFFFCFLFYFLAFNQFVYSQKVDIVSKANPLPHPSNDHIRIITQSCNYQYYDRNNLWEYMVPLEPDIITLLGDTVYLDAEPCNNNTQECKTMFDLICDVIDCNKAEDFSCFNYCFAEVNWYENPMEQYNFLLNSTKFTLNKAYNRSTWPVPVLPIWDDHDFCKDNANGTCIFKNVTRDAFVEFMKAIDQTNTLTDIIDEKRKNKDTGVFYYIDYNKTFSDNRTLKVRFYMLDVRWYRSKEDILGSPQRSWFEDLILNNDISDINYHIVCSGSVFYPTFGVMKFLAEPWNKDTKEWFVNVTTMANIRDRIIILTGDVHYSAVYKDNQTFEIVTSSMTHGIYDMQAALLEDVQILSGYLTTDVIAVENIGVLELSFDGFQIIFINQSGLPIVNYTYNYITDEEEYTIIQKNYQQQDAFSHFWNKDKWIFYDIAIALFVVSILGGVDCLYYRKKH